MTDLKLYGVNFAYQKDRNVLHDIDISIEHGKSVGLIGANGAGKSTLLKLLVGLLTGYEGSIEVLGQSVEKKNLADIRKKTGYVFQDSDSQLFMSTVYEDVAFGPRNYGYSEEKVEKKVMDALQKVHMENLKDRQIYRMSGGQKKLAAIATILSMEPEIVLLDEPTIALDPKNRRNLIGVLNEMPETKIIASHDLDMILDTCEETILLAEGDIICQGRTEDILKDKELLEKHDMELPLSMQEKGGFRNGRNS
ncbi:MAG: ABC transporter ATP-binding protein [Lachnospiraceae bacterium]|nr:ABC transporter ATP-binding protein [Lachnospiraceae bacterium]